MSFLDNLKNAIFMDDDDDDDDELYERELREAERKEKRQAEKKEAQAKKNAARKNSEERTRSSSRSSASAGQAAQERRKSAQTQSEKSTSSYSRPITPPRSPEGSYTPRPSRPVRRTQDASDISIYKAKSFSDAQVVCDSLSSGRAIIVSFDELGDEESQRIMDFICGAIYVLEGNIHTISGKIYLFSPKDVEVSGDYMSMVQKNGFGVPTFNKMI